MYHGPGPRYYNPHREPSYDVDGGASDVKNPEAEAETIPEPLNLACPMSVNRMAKKRSLLGDRPPNIPSDSNTS